MVDSRNVRVITDPEEAERVRLTEAQSYADRLFHYTGGKDGVCYCETREESCKP